MKYSKHLICLVMLSLLIVTVACNENKELTDAKKIVAKWVGKEIHIPTDIPCVYLGKDTVSDIIDTPFKILVYTDSTGCTTCKLNLYKWNALIEEVNQMMADKVSFHFYFQPKDKRELKLLLRRDNFKEIVYIDDGSKLNKLNRFPKKENYQCFLLNKDNRVVLIGNPTTNPVIWELYKQTIMGEEYMRQKDSEITAVEIKQAEIELENLKINQTSVATFTLQNTGDAPLVITDVTAACGCTVPEWDKRPVNIDDKIELKVKVTPDVSGYFRKSVIVFCNTKEGTVQLVVKGKTRM